MNVQPAKKHFPKGIYTPVSTVGDVTQDNTPPGPIFSKLAYSAPSAIPTFTKRHVFGKLSV